MLPRFRREKNMVNNGDWRQWDKGGLGVWDQTFQIPPCKPAFLTWGCVAIKWGGIYGYFCPDHCRKNFWAWKGSISILFYFLICNCICWGDWWVGSYMVSGVHFPNPNAPTHLGLEDAEHRSSQSLRRWWGCTLTAKSHGLLTGIRSLLLLSKRVGVRTKGKLKERIDPGLGLPSGRPCAPGTFCFPLHSPGKVFP